MIMNYNVRINEVKNQDSKVKAFANVTFGDVLAVRNISIVERKDGGGFFISMPSYKSDYVDEYGMPEYKDICFPITSEFHKELTDNILAAFQAKVDGMLDKEGMNFGDDTDKAPEYSVKITPVEKEESTLCGYGQITLDNCFVISNVSVVQGQYGEFVSMPSFKAGGKNGGYRDIAFPVTKEFREELFASIIDSYHQAMAQQQTMDYNRAAQPQQSMVAESRPMEPVPALR
jgi:DNA-binding cell septation regulator SpoVG